MALYATINQNITGRTETTLTIQWTTDAAVDYLWYSTGTQWTGVQIAVGTSGSYTIENLSPDTAYSVQTRVRRKDTQMTTDSSVIEVSTYDYPHANSTPSFQIGEELTVGLFNPLGREITVELLGANGSVIGGITTTGTQVSGWNDSLSRSRLLSSIPNTKTGQYLVRVTYAGNAVTRPGSTYSTTTVPSVGSVSYSDTNTDVTSITGNNKWIVQDKSTVRFVAANLLPGTSATLKKCVVSVDGVGYDMQITGTTAIVNGISVSSGSDVVATVTVTDSRGMTASKSVTVTVLPWSLPTAIVSVQRQSNYYSATDIYVNADYATLNGRNSVTILYQYKKTTDGTWLPSIAMQDDSTVTVTLDNNYSWNVQIIVRDIFGTTVYNTTVPKGMPIAFFDVSKHSTGFNCLPVHENSVEINGHDLLVHHGESLTVHNIVAGGMLTNSGTEIQFSVTLPKFVIDLNATITAMRLNVRITDGGYAMSSGYVTDGYDVMADSSITKQAVVRTANTVNFTLTKSSAYNGTNNTPVAVQIHTITLAF